MAIQNMHTLSEVIKRTYTSLEQPDFSFVSKAISSKPYGSLIQKIGIFFEVEEITDSNDDVSFRYLLSKSRKQWIIELSMLGFYATVFRISDVGSIIVVTKNTSVQDEKKLVSLLMEYRLKILEEQELEQPFPIKLSNTEVENTCIYQALFSDTDVLPWKA